MPTCFDYPQYWDLAFRSETTLEADFIEAACAKYLDRPAKRLLEPGCGGGRLVVAMAARGYEVVGFDLSETSIEYVKKRLRRRGLAADLFVGDMVSTRVRPKVDAAFCTFNTFRYLTSEQAARAHLEAVAASLRSGGVYILGLHLMPPDADLFDSERWTARHGKTKVTMSLRVVDVKPHQRIEMLRHSLRVRSGDRDLRFQSDHEMRTYTAKQFTRLLASVPALQLCDVYDFWYDIEDPLELNDDMADTVFVLRNCPE